MTRKNLIATIAIVFMFGLAGSINAATTVPLGSASDFAVLAGSAISDAAPATGSITGDVGLQPTGGATITGLKCAEMTGVSKIYDNDAGYTGNPAGVGCRVTDAGLLALAKTALVAAYTDASQQLQ